jgi:hypothetical protein
LAFGWLGAVESLAACLRALLAERARWMSIAVRMDRPLVTGNTADFQAIQRTGVNLVLENWREERSR